MSFDGEKSSNEQIKNFLYFQPHPENREGVALVVGLVAVVRLEAPMSVDRDGMGVLLIHVY